MDDLDLFLDQFETKPKKQRPTGDDSVARVLDDEFAKLGYGDTARLSILGDVGRENSWNRNTIFGTHKDPKNKKTNRGIISWQGDRRTKLDNHLKGEGVLGRGDDEELRGMARFMDKEMRESFPDAHKRLSSAKSTREASEALRKYIKYDPSSPYNSPDPEFRVKNNATWAKRARSLGLAQKGLGDYLDQFDAEGQGGEPDELDAFLDQFEADKTGDKAAPPLGPTFPGSPKPLTVPQMPVPTQTAEQPVDMSQPQIETFGGLRTVESQVPESQILPEVETQATLQARFGAEKAKNPSLTVGQFNTALATEHAVKQEKFKLEQAKARTTWLDQNPAYRDFLTQTGLPDDENSVAEFNIAQKASVDLANQENQKAYEQDKAAMDEYNASLPKGQRQTAASTGTPADGRTPEEQEEKVRTSTPLAQAKNDAEVLAKGSAGRAVPVDLKKKPKGVATGRYLFTEAMKALAPEYGYTDADVEAVADRQGGKYSQRLNDITDEQIADAVKNGETGVIDMSISLAKINELLKFKRRKTNDSTLEPEVFERVAVLNAQIDRSPEVSRRDFGSYIPEAEAERLLTEKVKSPTYAAQQNVAERLQDPTNYLAPVAMYRSMTDWAWRSPEPSDEWVQQEKARLVKQHGDYGKAWNAEQYYEGMSAPETAIRFVTKGTQSFVKNLIASTAETVTFLSQVQEDSWTNPLNKLLPDEAKIGVRNAVNVAEFFTRLISSKNLDTAVKQTKWDKGSATIDEQTGWKAIQEFKEAIGDDPVLQGRFIGHLADGGGSAASFIALGVAMPSMAVKVPGKLLPRIFGKELQAQTAGAGVLQMAGPGYGEGREAGLDESKSRFFGGVSGLLGVSELVGGGQGLVTAVKNNKYLRGKLANALLEVGRETGRGIKRETPQEFAQEVFQTVSGGAIKEYLKESNDVGTLDKLTNALNRLPKQIASAVSNEGVIGAITGGIMGGAGGAAKVLTATDKVEPGQLVRIEGRGEAVVVEDKGKNIIVDVNPVEGKDGEKKYSGRATVRKTNVSVLPESETQSVEVPASETQTLNETKNTEIPQPQPQVGEKPLVQDKPVQSTDEAEVTGKEAADEDQVTVPPKIKAITKKPNGKKLPPEKGRTVSEYAVEFEDGSSEEMAGTSREAVRNKIEARPPLEVKGLQLAERKAVEAEPSNEVEKEATPDKKPAAAPLGSPEDLASRVTNRLEAEALRDGTPVGEASPELITRVIVSALNGYRRNDLADVLRPFIERIKADDFDVLKEGNKVWGEAHEAIKRSDELHESGGKSETKKLPPSDDPEASAKPVAETDEADDLFEQAFGQKYGTPEKVETPEKAEPESKSRDIEINGETVATAVTLPRSMRFVDLDEVSQRGIRKAIGAADLEADALIFAVDDKNKVAFAYNPAIADGSGRFVSAFPTAKGREIAQHLKFEGMLLKYSNLADTLTSLENATKPDQKKPKAPKATATATPAQNDALTNLAAAFGFSIPDAPKVEGPQLEDFGQKIGGARKDMWADRGLTFADVAAMIPREREKLVRKDQIWPKPDYQEIYERFLAEGLSQEDASTESYLVKMIYDSIEQPPLKKWTRYGQAASDEDWQRYISFVEKVRDAMSAALSDANNFKGWKDAFPAALKNERGSIDLTFTQGRSRYALSNPAGERYTAARKAKSLGFPSTRELWMRDYKVVDGNTLTVDKPQYRYAKNGNEWIVESPGSYGELADFATEEEAQEYAKTFEGSHLLLTQSGKLVQSFATQQAAADSARKRYAEAHKRPTGEPTRPMLQGIKRGGVDYLKGKPAKPEQFVETFGFKGVEFGNWLSKEDRQQSLDYAYNALMDLADVIKVSPQALSLGGKLSLAFGSRGRKGALAHYEPSRIAINLTKMSGAGSLAHEWAHALDDYFGSQAAKVPYAEGPHQGYASQMTHRGGIRYEMQQAWNGVVSRIIERNATNEETVAEALAQLNTSRNNTISWMSSVFSSTTRATEQYKTALESLKKDFDGDMRGVDALNKFVAELTPLQKLRAKEIKILDERRYWLNRGETQMQRAVAGEIVKKSPTDYITHAKNLDKMFKSKPYWSTVLEMFARGFESYVQDRTDSKSQYLVHGTDLPVHDYTGKGGTTLPASPYPQGAEREAINTAFDNFFDVVEEEVDDAGVVTLKSALPKDTADERYETIIKPALADAFKQYAFEHDTPIEAMTNLLNALEARGFTPEQIRQMKPDITRFARENFLQKPKEESIDKGDERTDLNQDSEDGDGGLGSEDVPGTTEDELTESGDQGTSDDGDGDVSTDVRGGAESGSDDETTGSGSDKGGVSTGTRGSRRGNKSGDGVSDPGPAGDYIAPDGSLTRKGSWRDAATNNLDAIELAKQIESEGRRATLEEQEKLAKFVGWGASELANNVFKDPNGYSIKPEWKEIAARLREVMTPEERATAENSTQYAHYTSEKIIRGIWSAVQRFGFESGSILEPGMGTGLFPIAAPQNLIEKSAYTGIEKDIMTARIAKLLLPDSAVLETDFTKQTLPDNHFDVAIGNPPFARTKIEADPKYKRYRFLLHDYFFAKSLDAVRPGGLLVFVTSKGTMDKAGDAARTYMSEKADLLGAIRLPQTAFKDNAGTDVVTDVLFFRKRMAGEDPSGEKWLGHADITALNKWNEEHTGPINEYFVNHPEMVLGEHSFTGSMRHGDNEYTVKPNDGDIEEQFQNAVKNLPTGVFAKQAQSQEIASETANRDWDPKAKKEGSLYLHDDGRLMRREGGSGVEVKLTDRETKWLKDYVGLRDALKQAQFDQLHAEDGTGGDWAQSLQAVNKTYDSFVKKHGNILEYTDREKTKVDDDGNEVVTVSRTFKNSKLLFGNDIESPLVWTLERITDDGDIVKSKWLKERTIKPPEPPKIENVKDALMVSLDQTGALNIGHIVQLMEPIAPITEDEVISTLGDLIYEAPGGGWIMADEYLSGNVKDKLEAAEAAAADPKYRRNVEALRKVQPLPLPPEKITVQIGATWVPAEHVNAFAKEVLGLSGMFDRASHTTRDIVEFDPATNIWTVPGAHGSGSQSKRAASAEWGTGERSPEEILEAALNSQTVTIMAKDDDGRKYVDKEAMAQVQAIIERMNNAFGPWLFEDPDRQKELTDYYNRKLNVIAKREFNGEHLTTPGLSFRYELYPHQKRAVWRVIQTGNTYLGHAVGAGKTLEMIVSAMEQKRLGKISKPMFVVPRHMLEQFASDFLSAYPLANIMVADEANFHTDNRRKFIAQAALNDLDAIVIPHSSFGLLRTSEESSRIVLDDLLAEMRDAMEALTTGTNSKGEPKGDSLQDTATIKRIQQRIESIEQKFYGRMNSARDNVLNFEELGVDFLYVDEAHEFRKLDFTTIQSNLKGVDPMGSMRALDLLVKSRWLDRKRPGRSLVLASGTPLTNTMAELYTIQRFLGHRKLIADGLDHFDGWARQYGKVEEHIEPNAAGQYQPVKRFQRFINTGVLMQGVQQFMDILTLKQMIEEGVVKVPRVKGGKPQIIVGEPPAALVEYKQGELSRRIEISKNWKPSPPDEMHNPDPMIAIIGDAQLAGFDMRFIDPKLPNDPSSKLNLMIDGIIDSYNAHNDLEYFNPETGEAYPIKGAAHIVFTYGGIGEGVIQSRGFDSKAWIRKRLIDGGVPNNEIAFMSDYPKTSQKEAMFREMREGKKKILIATPKNAGTGVNVQLRLKTLHYGMAPWYPADVEQPDGRIVRQGNQNEEVELSRYAIKATYDETQWAMLSRKSRNVEDVLMGTYDGDVEDLSESSQYAMASALVSGDPRAIRVAQLRGEVEKYTRLEQGYYSTRHRLEYQLRDLNSEWGGIPSNEKQIRLLDEAIAAAPDEPVTKETFSIKIGKDTFDKTVDKNNADVGTALKKAWTDQIAKNKKTAIATTRDAEFDVATVLGKFPITGKVWVGHESNIFSNLSIAVGPISIRLTDSPFGTNERRIDADISESGLITRIVNAINGLQGSMDFEEARLAERRKEKAQVQTALDRTFEHADALAAAREELNRLQQEMVSDGAELPAVALTATDIESIQDAYQPNLVPGSREDVEHEPVDSLNNTEVAALDEAYQKSKLYYGPLKSALRKLDEDNVAESDRMTVEEMKDLSYAPIDDLIDGRAQVELINGHIKANAASHEIYRRTLEQVRIDKGNLRIGSKNFEDLFTGLFQKPSEVEETVAALEKKREEARGFGYSPSEIAVFDDHINALKESAAANQGTAVMYILDKALPHEMFHQADYMGAVDKALMQRHSKMSAASLDAHKVTEILSAKHFSRFNTFSQLTPAMRRAWIRSEIPPHLLELSEQELRDQYGITPEMAADYMLQWFKGYVAKNGIDSLDHFDREEINAQEFITQARESFEAERAKNDRFKQAGKADTSRQNDTGSGKQSDAGSNERGARFDENHEAGSDFKLRSLPKTMRAAGLNAIDESYEVYHDTAATADAAAILEERGIEGSIKLLRDLPASAQDAQHAILSFMLIRTLQDHAHEIAATDPDTAKQHYDLSIKLAQEHAQRATQAGRFTRMPSVIGPTLEHLMYSVQGVISAKYGEDKALGDEERVKWDALGRQLEEAFAQITDLKKKSRNQDAVIKRLKDEKEGKKRRRSAGSGKSRAKLVQLVKDEKQKNVDAIRAKLRERFAEPILKMTAWHGSPHTFDKFDISKIGTGEGAQAYGHGLYFAGAEDVAEHYKNQLGNTIPIYDGAEIPPSLAFGGETNHDKALQMLGKATREGLTNPFGAVEQRLEYYRSNAESADDVKNLEVIRGIREAFEQLIPDKFETKRTGSKYRVDLKPEQDEYLLWDKPLSEQSEKVKAAFAQIPQDIFDSFEDVLPFGANYAQGPHDRDIQAGLFYKDLSRLAHDDYLPYNEGDEAKAGDQLTSEYLKSLGIRGIKYLDGTSRGKGEGSYNYVIFDDADVEIEAILKSAVPEDFPLDDFAEVGAMMLTEGLSGDEDYLPHHFEAEMVADYGDSVVPYFDEIYKASWAKRNEWLAEIRYQQTKERIEAKYNEGEELEDWQIEEIIGEQKDKARRRRAIENYHRMASGDPYLENDETDPLKAVERGRQIGRGRRSIANARAGINRDITDLKRIISELVTDDKSIADNDKDAIAVGAIMHAESLTTSEMYKQMTDLGFGIDEKAGVIDRVKQAARQREILRRGKDVLDRAKTELKIEKDAIANEILDAEKELKTISDLRWKARNEMAKVQRTVNDEMRRIKSGELKYQAGKIVEATHAMRTMMASFDMSGALRQGGWFTFAKPEMQKAAFVNMFKSIREKGYGRAIMDIETQPLFTLMQRSGIDFAMAGRGEKSSLSGEELFRGDQFIEKIPLLGWLASEGIVKPSERTYTAFLDTQRAIMADLMFRDLMAEGKTYARNENEFKNIAKFINVATGRGTVPTGRLGRIVMELPLFAPRYTISRFQLINMTLNPVSYYNMPPASRKIVAKSAARFYGTVGTILGIMAALGFASFDSDDDDFLKIKIGNTRYDLLAGMGPVFKLITKVARSGYRTKFGFDNRLPQEFWRDNFDGFDSTIWRFARGKLAPTSSLIVDMLNGKDYIGNKVDPSEPMDWAKGVGKRLIPLTVSDMIQAGQTDGAIGILKSTPFTFFGLGASTYKGRLERPETEAEKLASKAAGWNLKGGNKREREVLDLKAELVARSRMGEDVFAEMDKAIAEGKFTDRDKSDILGAAKKTLLEDKAENLELDYLIEVIKAATATEKAILMPIANKKMKNADVKGTLDADTRKRLEAIGARVVGHVPMPDAVKDAFDDLGIKTPDVSEYITPVKGGSRIKMDSSQYDKYRSETLTRLYSKVGEIIQTDEYLKASETERVNMVEKAMRQQRAEEQRETGGDFKVGKTAPLANLLKAGETKSWTTDDWVTFIEQTTDLTPAEVVTAKEQLKKKAENARKSKTFTEDEAARVMKVLNDPSLKAKEKPAPKKLVSGPGGEGLFPRIDIPRDSGPTRYGPKLMASRQSENVLDYRSNSPVGRFMSTLSDEFSSDGEMTRAMNGVRGYRFTKAEKSEILSQVEKMQKEIGHIWSDDPAKAAKLRHKFEQYKSVLRGQ